MVPVQMVANYQECANLDSKCAEKDSAEVRIFNLHADADDPHPHSSQLCNMRTSATLRATIIHWGYENSGDLNSEQVWYSNGPK